VVFLEMQRDVLKAGVDGIRHYCVVGGMVLEIDAWKSHLQLAADEAVDLGFLGVEYRGNEKE
jgi:hypothetical protein